MPEQLQEVQRSTGPGAKAVTTGSWPMHSQWESNKSAGHLMFTGVEHADCAVQAFKGINADTIMIEQCHVFGALLDLLGHQIFSICMLRDKKLADCVPGQARERAPAIWQRRRFGLD